jgi:hypothetical protein
MLFMGPMLPLGGLSEGEHFNRVITTSMKIFFFT